MNVPDLDPPISIINECACTFKTYDHYDVDKPISIINECACTFKTYDHYDVDKPISIINECACTFKIYDHYDVDKRIRNAININRLNLITLEPALNILGENILNKYQDINPSKEMINKLTSELTSGLYNCCIGNYFHVELVGNLYNKTVIQRTSKRLQKLIRGAIYTLMVLILI